MRGDVPSYERARRNHPKSPPGDVVERESGEFTGQTPMFELGGDLGMHHDPYAGPVPVTREPGEGVVDEDLVPMGIGVIHHPHRVACHRASLANVHPDPASHPSRI